MLFLTSLSWLVEVLQSSSVFYHQTSPEKPISWKVSVDASDGHVELNVNWILLKET